MTFCLALVVALMSSAKPMQTPSRTCASPYKGCPTESKWEPWFVKPSLCHSMCAYNCIKIIIYIYLLYFIICTYLSIFFPLFAIIRGLMILYSTNHGLRFGFKGSGLRTACPWRSASVPASPVPLASGSCRYFCTDGKAYHLFAKQIKQIQIEVSYVKGETPNHPKLDHLSIEAHGFGDPPAEEPRKSDNVSPYQPMPTATAGHLVCPQGRPHSALRPVASPDSLKPNLPRCYNEPFFGWISWIPWCPICLLVMLVMVRDFKYLEMWQQTCCWGRSSVSSVWAATLWEFEACSAQPLSTLGHTLVSRRCSSRR